MEVSLFVLLYLVALLSLVLPQQRDSFVTPTVKENNATFTIKSTGDVTRILTTEEYLGSENTVPITKDPDRIGTDTNSSGRAMIGRVLRHTKIVLNMFGTVMAVHEAMKPILLKQYLQQEAESDADLPGPLMLTPYIEGSALEAARNLSQVSGTFIDGTPFPPSHAGFITVDKSLGSHIHFWFFPSTSDPEAPLMVWMNGGPSISSMQGLLWSQGPITFYQSYLSPRDIYFTKRDKTWVGPYSVVYVDIVGRGFSYSESGEAGKKATQEGYTADLNEFFKQFVQMFPEYETRGVYIAGQSYAGHYVPALAYAIHTDIKRGNSRVNLKGVILGAPCYFPHVQDLAFWDYFYALGGITIAQLNKWKKTINDFYAKLADGRLDVSVWKLSELYSIFLPYALVPGRQLHNYVTAKAADHDALQLLMSKKSTRKLVHAGNRRYRHANMAFYQRFGPDYVVGTSDKLGELMDNYKVLIYNGDLDLILSSASIEAAVLSTPWAKQDEYYKNSERLNWPGQRSRNGLAGYYTKVGQFCRVVIHGAGHEVPYDQPEASLKMVTQFRDYGCIKEKSGS